MSRCISFASSHLVCRTRERKQVLGNLQVVCFALVSGSARQSQVCRGVAQKRGREILQGCVSRCISFASSHLVCRTSGFLEISKSSGFRLFCFGFRERKTKPSLSGCAQKRGREILQGCVSRCISCASSHLVCRTGAHKRLLGNLEVVWFASCSVCNVMLVHVHTICDRLHRIRFMRGHPWKLPPSSTSTLAACYLASAATSV